MTSIVGGVLSAKDGRQSGQAAFLKSRIFHLRNGCSSIFWSRQLPVTDAELQLEITRGTAIDIYQWLREVCSTKLLATPIVLGGPGTIVQIDESV